MFLHTAMSVRLLSMEHGTRATHRTWIPTRVSTGRPIKRVLSVLMGLRSQSHPPDFRLWPCEGFVEPGSHVRSYRSESCSCCSCEPGQRCIFPMGWRRWCFQGTCPVISLCTGVLRRFAVASQHRPSHDLHGLLRLNILRPIRPHGG